MKRWRIKAVHSKRFPRKKRDDVDTLGDEGRRIAKKRFPVRARLEPVEPAEYADKDFAPVSMLRFAVW